MAGQWDDCVLLGGQAGSQQLLEIFRQWHLKRVDRDGLGKEGDGTRQHGVGRSNPRMRRGYRGSESGRIAQHVDDRAEWYLCLPGGQVFKALKPQYRTVTGVALLVERGWPIKPAALSLRGSNPADIADVHFIHDPYPTYDLCHSPSLLSTHGSHSFPFPRESKLRPLFQLSKFSRDPSFLTTPLEAYDNHTSDAGAAKYAPWADKTVDKLFWRGSSTGDHYSHRKGYDWRKSHRPRLHFLAQATEGQVGLWVQRGKEWVWEMVGKGKVNERYMDVGLTGKPHQVSVAASVLVQCTAEGSSERGNGGSAIVPSQVSGTETVSQGGSEKSGSCILRLSR